MRRSSLLRCTQTHFYCRKPSNKYTNVLFLWQACTQADSFRTQGRRDDTFLSSCLMSAANSAFLVEPFFPKCSKTHPRCWNLWEQKGVRRQIRLLSGYPTRFKSYRTKIPKRSCDPAPRKRSRGLAEPNIQRKHLLLTSVRAEVNKAVAQGTGFWVPKTAPTIRAAGL